jgi:hypothetical protein
VGGVTAAVRGVLYPGKHLERRTLAFLVMPVSVLILDIVVVHPPIVLFG